MKGDEIDIDGKTNLNRPFKLTGTTGGDIVLSKKNEIVLLSKSSSGGGYTHSSIYYARDNFFGKGAIDPSGNIFIVNTAKSGFEKISAGFNYQSHIKTSYPVYNIVHNHLNNKLYFFNRLASAGTGFYAYDIETGTQTFVETSKAIGDLIYNPINNQILVSEYAPSDENNAHILVYDAVNPSSATTLSYSDDGGYFDFAGRMFAAPNGKIYISMNMRADDNLPKIVVIDGSSYDKLLTVASGILSFPPEYCSSFQSFYCYNKYDKKVYATFGIYFPSFNQPYQTSYNSSLYSNMEPFEYLPTGNYSKLVEIGEDAISTNRYDINSPSEIICSTPLAGQDKDYEGVLFINTAAISDDFLTGGLHIFDCATNEFIFIEQDDRIHEIYDMTYCPLTESLYAFNIEEIEVDNIANQKITHVFKVSEDGTYTDIWQQDGVAASINYNEFDSQLYVYYKGQYEMFGLNQNYAKIFTLDPFAENNAETGDINLPYMNMYPEMVPQANHPHFNPYNNKAYFPNGTHSSVSVVGFVAKEALTLTVRPNWISIPRHLGNLGQNDNEYWPTNQVFTQNTIQNGFQTLNLKRYHVEPTPPHSAEYKYADYITYPEPAWSYTPDYTNQNIYSTRGYKLEYTPNDEEKLLYMEGFVEDPETYIQLYENNMNWVGYFLHKEQDAFNALGASVLTDLTEVWGQDFYCYRRNGIIQDGPTHGSIEGTYWVCDQTRRTVHYGDMLSLTSMATTNFQWQGTGTPPREELRPIVSYFEYDETLAYTPIIIEIDYNENPMELGAFIDTLCVGAVALLPEDSAVILRAYLEEGYAPEDIVFQEYYGTKTSNNNVVANYSVFNKMTEKFENRPLTGKVGNELVYISFKYKKVDDNEGGEIDINFWPNSAHDQLNYSFYADSDGHLNISLYGINGKLVSVLIDKVCEKGAVYGITELKGLSGHISQGIYFVKTKFGNSITTKKIVVQ